MHTKFKQFEKWRVSLRGGLVCCIIRMGHHQTDLWLGDEVGIFLEGKLINGLFINHTKP